MIITPYRGYFWREVIVDAKRRADYAKVHDGAEPNESIDPALRYVVPLSSIENVRTTIADLEKQFQARSNALARKNPWSKLIYSSGVGVLGIAASLILGAPEAAIAVALAAGGYSLHGFPDEEQRAGISPRAHMLNEKIEELIRNGSLFLLPENIRVTETTDKRAVKAVEKLREYITVRESLAATTYFNEVTHEEGERVRVKLSFLRDEIDELLNGREKGSAKGDNPSSRGKEYRRRSFASRLLNWVK